ncbi:MAG TPA: site-2 protease family protein [Longimicrobiales bacterium]|nr:site-2 protease family protein [Longimicrobiales bacterium]
MAARTSRRVGPAGGLRVGSLLGFEIRLDLSWFLVVLLVFWSLAEAVFPERLPELGRSAHMAMGAAGTVLFFASLLAHELSHAIVARAKGIPVHGITLFVFGGVAQTRREADTPADELQIAGIGPLTSLALALLFEGIRRGSLALGLGPAVPVVAAYLSFINLALAVFNLVPGFPLDGGRIFRAVAWRATGDRAKATRWAVGGGRIFGTTLMVLGAVQAFAGAPLGGLWLVFIGWFLRNLAGATLQQQALRALLRGSVVADLMTPRPEVVPARLSLAALVQERFMRLRYAAYPVVEGPELVGLVTLEDVKRVQSRDWGALTVADVMTPIADCAVVAPWTSVEEALERMDTATARGRALVVDGGVLTGIVTGSDVTRWIRRLQAMEGLLARAG